LQEVVQLHGMAESPTTLFLVLDYCAGGPLHPPFQNIRMVDVLAFHWPGDLKDHVAEEPEAISLARAPTISNSRADAGRGLSA